MRLCRSPSFLAPDLFEANCGPDWPFAPLVPKAYGLIMIDCPWHFQTRSKAGWGKSPQAQYDTMTIADIAALPVGDLAAEDCVLWMWGTAPMMDRQIEILKGWGFSFASSGVWLKKTKHGKLAMGTGYWLRNAHEPFFIGTRGKPRIHSRGERSVLEAKVREHSRKPDEAYAMARRIAPVGRAADVFARQSRPGWETWGNEAKKFDEENRNAHA